MTKYPVISILVPVYKAEKYLPDCLDSILSQTFTNFELILVNDGSPDKSGAICDSYAIKDHRIKVIHKTNGGASTARKTCVEAATGKYIGWVDADDRIAPDMFSLLYNLAEEYRADITECQYIMINGHRSTRSGKEEPIIYGNGDFILRQFFTSMMKPCFWNKLYKSELFSKIKFPGRQIHVDFYINVQFALMQLNYVRTSEAKYYYVVRCNSNITTFNARAIREAIYKYEYTINLSATIESELARKYLVKDAVNRLVGRYFEVSVNSDLTDQYIYTYFIKRKLGFLLFKYLLLANLPLKTRISYILLLSNMKGLQMFLHKHLGKNG